MFMKHTISRFFRFFLVAALVAAMAGSLLPSKALGIAHDPTTTVAVSTTTTGESPEWTIGFTAEESLVVGETNATIQVNFADAATVPDAVGEVAEEDILAAIAAATTVQSGDGGATAVVTVARDGNTITITTPVAIGAGDVTGDDPRTEAVVEGTDNSYDLGGTGTIVIGAEAGITLGAAENVDAAATPATGATVEVVAGTTTSVSARFAITTAVSVVRSSATAGSVTQWQIGFTPVELLSANASLVKLTFSHATVPSSIASSDISVLANDGDVTVGKLLEVAPTRTGNSITFFTPVSSAGGEPVTIVVATTAGVANGLRPTSAATVKVAAGTNATGTSAAFTVGQYLRFSPGKAARNATVTVSGGGFTSGTSGSIRIENLAELGDYDEAKSTGGTYTVDSAGKLTGSFVANSGTRLGGRLVVRDLGSGKPIWSSARTPFAQNASATPSSDNVALGAPVSVTLNDFDANAPITVSIAGGDPVALMTTGTTPEPVTTNARGGGAISILVPQDAGPGTKQVVVEAGKSARFLISIVTRTLTVSPSTAVPGQAITVAGSGFTTSSSGGVRVSLALGEDDITGENLIAVNTDGTFLYTGKVPFNEATGAAGGSSASSSIKWTAAEAGDGGREATSSSFGIQKRAVTLSPSTANPGATVEVYGSGWGVRTYDDVTSQVTLTLSNDTDASFGPFPVSSTGEFQGAFTVPSNSQVSTITVKATDNNGGKNVDKDDDDEVLSVDQGKTGGFKDNQSASKKLSVPTGVVTVSPNNASTGTVITITGKGFPAQTNLSGLKFGRAVALPVPAPATDVQGNFTVTLTVPAAGQGGSLQPGAVVITATVGQISGTTSFTIPGPTISLSADSGRPGESLTITGTGFSAYANVDSVNFGSAPALPVPNPRTDGVGDFSASVIVPTLNPGAYTITVRTGANFTATSPIRILSATSGRTVSPEIAFQSLTSRGLLTLAAAAAPGGTEFGAFVPGLAGNTLVQVVPNGVLILTLNVDAQIAVSGQPAVSVSADTPTFFALGAAVTVEVIE